jgi:hypothetical protein
MYSFGDICSLISISTASSLSSFLWQSIVFLWPWHWIAIFLALVVWVTWEIVTRNGTAHYNSDNGFSPSFNRFVGSGAYLGFQALIFLILKIFFGDIIYCFVLPYFIHLAVFFLTGLILHLSGFWPYLKDEGARHCRKKYYHRWHRH